MIDEQSRRTAVVALRAAVPYLRLFQGKTFVIKAGGKVVGDREQIRNLIEQVGILHRLGIRVVLVHGGGGQATALASSLGLETRFVQGRRVTDAPTRQVAIMALNGSVNTDIVSVCRELRVPALGVSGVDASLVRARRRDPVHVEGNGEVDYGYVGDIVSVDVNVLERILEERFVPIVSPLSADDKGEVLNINADSIASRFARDMKAEKLIVVTEALGILRDHQDPSSLVSYTDLEGLDALRDEGALTGGMLPKAEAIREALEGGVARAHVISSEVPDSLLLEVFTNEGCGTMVVKDTQTMRPEELWQEDGS